jgi:hypothetical protein
MVKRDIRRDILNIAHMQRSKYLDLDFESCWTLRKGINVFYTDSEIWGSVSGED